MKGWHPHRTALWIATVYIIALSWVCVHLWERVRELEAVLKLCSSFLYHTGGVP